MDKGIRPACRAKFMELLPTRAEVGNTRFRANVMAFIMDEFSITLASAATHYNDAFKKCKELNPALVEGLGRAEDKKGGRKPKVPVLVGPPAPLLMLGFTPQAVAEVVEPVQTLFTVKKKSDGSIIAADVSFETATALVAKAAAAKKAKLYFV